MPAAKRSLALTWYVVFLVRRGWHRAPEVARRSNLIGVTLRESSGSHDC